MHMVAYFILSQSYYISIELLIKGQAMSKWFFQANVSSKKRTNEFDFTTGSPKAKCDKVNQYLNKFWQVHK